MSTITKTGLLRHLRAEPNQFVLHYRRGKLVRQGPGLAYWFNPMTASVAELPIEDIESTFLLKERTADFQGVHVQATVTFRILDPARTASRFNFTVSTSSGSWTESPLERLSAFWRQRVQVPVREFTAAVPLTVAIDEGERRLRQSVWNQLVSDPEVEAVGLGITGVQIDRVSADAELEKAMQTPEREALQQRADEAMFARRAHAVEKERAIKENELRTEIELADQQEELIRREGENRLQEVRQEAATERARVEADVAREELAAHGFATSHSLRSDAEASAVRVLGEAQAAGEAGRVEAWRDAPPSILLGFAAQEFAKHFGGIEHLNITPSFLETLAERFLVGKLDG